MCILCALLCVAVAEKEKMLQNQTLPALHYLFFFLVFFFLFLLFFPACSPPLHQGRSSPGAEIQFRSSSSAFCALTCSQWMCAILSPPSSDWATRSRFFPLFPCCFIRMLQLCIKAHSQSIREARRRTASSRSLKLFIVTMGSPNLLRRWDIFTQLLPNGACGPSIAGRWLPLWRLLLCFYS